MDALAGRSEFYTSYTPYQAEASQGTLQAIYEFQSCICRLTEMEVANASLYDGASALVEAVFFSHRVLRGKRDRVIVAETVNPMYRQVLDTYAQAQGLEVAVVPAAEDGRIDPEQLASAGVGEACCVALQSPNFLGIVEDLRFLAAADELRMHHIERWQDAEDLVVEVGAVHTQVVCRQDGIVTITRGGYSRRCKQRPGQ